MATVTKLFDEAEIAQRVEELAGEIAGALPPDLMLVGVLKGSFVFMADLIRALDRTGQTPSVEFVRLSSYGHGRESAGDIALIGDVPAGVGGRAVLLVDDIADTGRSLDYARNLLVDAGARPIWSCALVDKPSRREIDFTVDFVGFTVNDVFVVGYGIDYAEDYRHLPYIGAVD
ncbi:MAG: hypoxanthine phosphoribosyltransferase [Alphaproteobacteria bacterium]|nr:hypoxanthine phosphoribosyltransferase [Alphaproteobacteria bacterium]